MRLIKSITLTTLILLSTSLNAQFTLDELKAIRVDQIRLAACDSLLLTKNNQLDIREAQILNLTQQVKTYEVKDSICMDERHYYLDVIRDRNESISRLEKKAKRNRIITVGSLVISGVLLLVILAP